MLQEFQDANRDVVMDFASPKAKTPFNTLRRVLQELRDDGVVSFVDNSGTYTLRGIDLLKQEQEEISTLDLTKEEPEKKEYLVETYVRKVKWAKLAIERLGTLCIFHKCKNTFLREDKTPYIEVHHIIPLCKGGEEGLWNLSVLCAHHHRMAHYSDEKTKKDVEFYLLKEVKSRL